MKHDCGFKKGIWITVLSRTVFTGPIFPLCVSINMSRISKKMGFTLSLCGAPVNAKSGIEILFSLMEDKEGLDYEKKTQEVLWPVYLKDAVGYL